jgi:hypothetical protein
MSMPAGRMFKAAASGFAIAADARQGSALMPGAGHLPGRWNGREPVRGLALEGR